MLSLPVRNYTQENFSLSPPLSSAISKEYSISADNFCDDFSIKKQINKQNRHESTFTTVVLSFFIREPSENSM